MHTAGLTGSGRVGTAGGKVPMGRQIKKLSVLFTVASLAVALLPQNKAGALNCAYEPGLKNVVVLTSGPTVLSVGARRGIKVDGIRCGLATVRNTDTIKVLGSKQADAVTISLRGGRFAPGATPELQGLAEIEFEILLGTGRDRLIVTGGRSRNVLHVGGSGVALNEDRDSDLTRKSVERFVLNGGSGNDDLSGRASSRLGGATQRNVSLHGEHGDDRLTGGRGNDRVIGGSGADVLDGGPGRDLIRGGVGFDSLSYRRSTEGVRVNLVTERARGQGKDRTGYVERLVGSRKSDTILVSRYRTEAYGLSGNDLIAGGEAADLLAGGPGTDRLNGGRERDTLIGGAGDDSLTGGPYHDVLAAGTGRDRCQADGGFDPTIACEGRIHHQISPPKQIQVVTQNLKEMHNECDQIRRCPVRDLASELELRNFARRLFRELTTVPDVVLLQEVIGRSARATARYLSKRFGGRYVAAVFPQRLYPRGLKARPLIKNNTAILVNTLTMRRMGRGGYFTVKVGRGEQARGDVRMGQRFAHTVLRERQTGKRVAVMSVHFVPTDKFRSRSVAYRRKGAHARQTMRFFEKRYGHAPIRVVGGDFNNRRCESFQEQIVCDKTPFYEVMTKRPFRYTDSVFARHNRGNTDIRSTYRYKRIDYVFTRGAVFEAWHDETYNTKRINRDWVADHRFVMAKVGLRK